MSLLLVVEYKEECVKVKLGEVCRLGVHRDCRVLVLEEDSYWLLWIRNFLVPKVGLVFERRIQKIHRLLKPLRF